MKKIVLELYDSLEDEYVDFLCNDNIEKDKANLVGFTFQANYNKDISCIKSEVNVALSYFKKMINVLIKRGNVEKIFYIGMIPLAITSPCIRVSFFCYCNDYGGKSTFEGYEIGEVPKVKSLSEVISFIEKLKLSND